MIFIEIGRIRRQHLREAGINYQTRILMDGESGITIEDDMYARALDVLNAKEVSRHPVMTSNGDAFQAVTLIFSRTQEQAGSVPAGVPVTGATPTPPPKEYKVSIGSLGGVRSEDVSKLIKETFIPFINKDVEIGTRDSYQDPTKEGPFRININSAPHMGNRMDTCPSTIFGIKIGTGSGTFTTSCTGYPLIDEETGREVGEVFDNTLYIFHYLFEERDPRALTLFKIFLEKTIEVLKMTPEQRGAYDRDEISRKNYVKILRSKHSVMLSHAVENIKNITEKVTKKRSELLDDIRRLNAEMALKEKLTQRDPKEEKIFLQQFDEFKNIHGVRKVAVRDNILVIDTNTLYCTDPRSKIIHEIGEFRIKIDTSIGQLRWKNKTHPSGINSMQAPHVFNDGRACMGNSEEIFTDLIAKFELPAAIMMAINFVEEVNTDDGAGRQINTWPHADLEKMKKDAEAEKARREAPEPTGVPVA
jgi:hypothetical protein